MSTTSRTVSPPRLATRAHWWVAISSHCAAHHGVVGATELESLGVPTTAVRALVRGRRLEKVAPGVWRAVGSPDSWEQQLRAGLLSLGPLAMISHEAAAQIHAFELTPPDMVEFLVPVAARRVRGAWRVHSSRHVERLDRVVVGGWPVTSATRTVLDLAMLRPGFRRLEAAIESAIRSRSSSPAVLERRLSTLRGRGRWGCRTIEALLADAGGESALERRFLALVRHARLPRPDTQYRVTDGSRTVARVDFVWPDLHLVVEVSGALGHSTPSERRKDARRRNELQAMGFTVLEYTWHDVRYEPDRVVSTLRAHLRAAGWPG